MDLLQSSIGEHDTYTGSTVVEVTAGQSLKIETTPGGSEVLDFECAEGKRLVVTITVNIIEQDV